MANSVLCTKCENWVHGKCAKIKRATTRLAMHFVCSKCIGITEGKVDLIKMLHNEVEIANGFCYLEDRLNASSGCEAAVTARVRIGWVRFRECGELLLENRFPLKMKSKVYRCCISSSSSSDSVSIRCCPFSRDGRIYPMHGDLLERNFSTGSMPLFTPNLSFLT